MSQIAASAGYFAPSVARRDEREDARKLIVRRAPAGWSAESFAHEQLQGLVHKLFFSGQGVRHVLFSAIDRKTHIDSIARLIGEVLAVEKAGSVAVMARVSHEVRMPQTGTSQECTSETTPLRQTGLRLKENLWLLPDASEDRASVTAKLPSRIFNLRREFDYSVLVCPMADSHELLATARIADGIVLALSAGHTHRATARNAMRFLESANIRVLGTVLTDRVFPIPANIYWCL
jgi:hypothetical protein